MASINDIIERFQIVNKERTELNTKIRNHFEPLLYNAKNEEEFYSVFNEIPDCPYYLSALRLAELRNFLKK